MKCKHTPVCTDCTCVLHCFTEHRTHVHTVSICRQTDKIIIQGIMTRNEGVWDDTVPANHQMSQALLSVQTFANNSIYQFDSCTQHSFTSSDAKHNGPFCCPKMKHCCRKYPAEVTDCLAPPMFTYSAPGPEDPRTSHNLQTHSYTRS